jgi:hypothetical protein
MTLVLAILQTCLSQVSNLEDSESPDLVLFLEYSGQFHESWENTADAHRILVNQATERTAVVLTSSWCLAIIFHVLISLPYPHPFLMLEIFCLYIPRQL